MSNRLLGIIIIIGFIGAGYIYYSLYYIPKQNEALKLKKEATVLVEEKQPELIEIYTEKKIEKTNIEKIEDIKQKSKYYLYFELKNKKRAYIKKSNYQFDLYYSDKLIATFDEVDKKNMTISLVRGTSNDLYIQNNNIKYYYNYLNNSLVKIDLFIDVKYVKKGSNNTILFVTTKGTFIYSQKEKELNYFSYFNDFLLLDDYYIGLINKDDTRRLKNLGFKTEKNLIILYNPNTKEKKIIYETNIAILEIYMQNNILYILDKEGGLYNLENFN